MTKTDSYRGVKYTIKPADLDPGNFIINATYKRTDVRVATRSYSIYHYSGDKEFIANRNVARKAAYELIREAYESNDNRMLCPSDDGASKDGRDYKRNRTR